MGCAASNDSQPDPVSAEKAETAAEKAAAEKAAAEKVVFHGHTWRRKGIAVAGSLKQAGCSNRSQGVN